MAQQSVEILLDGEPCVVWNEDYDDIADKATSYENPLGPKPGTAYVLMLAKDLANVNTLGPVQLSLSAGGSIGISGLWFQNAVCVSGGAADEENRAYLVTLQDSRAILEKFTDINRDFNVRCPAPPTESTNGFDPEEFYASSLSLSESPCSWDFVVSTIWNALPAALVGPYPGLGIQPDGVPQNLRYNGVNAWWALHDVLAKLEMTTAYDPQNDKFSIVNLALEQVGFAALEANSANLLLEDNAPRGASPIFFPATIRVYFYRQAQHYGTEPDTPLNENWTDQAQLNWGDVPTGIAGAIPGTILSIFDDLPAIVDFEGETTNSAAGEERAAQVAETWIANMLNGMGRRSKIYQGIVPGFDTPGSQISYVSFHNLMGKGFVTEVNTAPSPAPRVNLAGSARTKASENYESPDLGRHTTPLYPRNLQLIQVDDGIRDANGLYKASVVRLDPSKSFSKNAPAVDLEPCFAVESSPGARRRRETCAVYNGRLNGTATNEDEKTLPLYVLESGAGQILLGKAQNDIPKDEFGSVHIWEGPPGEEVDTEVVVKLFNRGGATIKESDWVTFTNDCTGARLIVAAPGQALGKAFEDIENRSLGDVRIYTLEEGESQGQESDESGEDTPAYNYFFGVAPRNHWVWLASTSDGWYITQCEGGNLVYGQVKRSSESLDVSVHATMPGGTVQVTIWENSNATNTEITAAVEHAPIIDGEFVSAYWNGKQFVISSGDYDGGILATYQGGNSLAVLNRGDESTNFKIAQFPLTGPIPTQVSDFTVTNRIGTILAKTEVWISRNPNGFYVSDGHLSAVYGKVDQESLSVVNAKFPGDTAKIHVYQSGSDTGATIMAKVEHNPIIESEFVSCHWDGLQWIVGRGDYDGGINAKYNAPSQLSKGGSSNEFLLQIYPAGAPSPSSQAGFSITCRLGTIPAGKEVRISRDATGFYATAAEC